MIVQQTFTIIDAEQRSPEWFAARLGRLTGSRADDMLAAPKKGGEEPYKRRDYRIELICERLTGRPADENGFVSKDMQRGTDLEPAAFAAYEARTGHLVRRTGFLRHDALMAGCSLDGDVDDFMGIVELKCPKAATHLKYRNYPDKLIDEYSAQVTHNLWISGAEWCDLASYDPRFPSHLQLVIVRVTRDDAQIAAYKQKAIAFLDGVDAGFAALTRLEVA